jgi:hypothetical protein
MLNLYIEAEKAVLLNQSYKINDRVFTRANLEEITRNREIWETKLNKIARNRKGIKIKRGVVFD